MGLMGWLAGWLAGGLRGFCCNSCMPGGGLKFERGGGGLLLADDDADDNEVDDCKAVLRETLV